MSIASAPRTTASTVRAEYPPAGYWRRWCADAPPPQAPVNDPFDDLAFLRSVTESGDASSRAGTGAPAAGGDTLKTLRCTECGTMNLPTEWYCERCGGELAAF